MLPEVAVAARSPPTLEAARSRAIVLTTVASPVAPLVLTDTAPVEANPFRVMSLFAKIVVAVVVPPTVSVPTSVMSPVVAVTLRFWPTVLPLTKSTPVALTKVASPAPLVLTKISPVTARPLFNAIEPPTADVVKDALPATVTAPVSVMLLVVAVAERSPSTVEALKSMSVVLVIVALAVLPPAELVVSAILPATANVPAAPKVISALSPTVVKDASLPTVTNPLFVILPVVFAVTVRS